MLLLVALLCLSVAVGVLTAAVVVHSWHTEAIPQPPFPCATYPC